MNRRTAWILVAGVAALAIGAAAVGGLALVLRGQGRPGWGSESYLFVDLGGEVPEQPPSDLGSFLERRPPSLRTLVDSLDRAAGDSKVKAVVLRVAFLPDSGWGKVQELRDAVIRFRRSNKPVYAHLEYCGNKEYYLAAAATKIYAIPTAILDVSGLEAEVTFLRGTLDKLGVEAQFEGVGKYKNAPNQLTETGFTAPHREQMDALLDNLFQQYVAAIAKGRGKTLDEVRALVDKGPYDATGALKAGLVDELIYQDQIEERLKGAGRATPARYVRTSRGFGFDGRPRVALIYAVGEIVPGESHSGGLGGGSAGADTVSGALRRARNDDGIKAIVLRVNSPGGFGPAADVIWREVKQSRRRKPVIVSMGDYAASGGYYIAMGSDAIVAQPGTITGSIGVFSGKFSLKGLYDKIGVSKEILTRGKFAALGTDYRPWNAEERAKIRRQNEAFYEDFVKRAAEGRKMTAAQVDEVAQGRVWTGAEARAHGLVDQLGGLDVALALAKERAHVAKDQEVSVVVLPERKGFLEMLLERQEEAVSLSAVPEDVRAVLHWVRLLAHGGAMARMPFELRVR